MKKIIPLSLLMLLTSCSDKVESSLKILQDRTENKLVNMAGETEVILELQQRKYASMKERLVRLKTVQKMYINRLDEAYAAADTRMINVYEPLVKKILDQIPEAEKSLKEYYYTLQTEKAELGFLKESLLATQATGNITSKLEYDNKSKEIRNLLTNVNMKLARANTMLEVADLEETFKQ
jgi:hypothetical protein